MFDKMGAQQKAALSDSRRDLYALIKTIHFPTLTTHRGIWFYWDIINETGVKSHIGIDLALWIERFPRQILSRASTETFSLKRLCTKFSVNILLRSQKFFFIIPTHFKLIKNSTLHFITLEKLWTLRSHGSFKAAEVNVCFFFKLQH